MGKDSQPRFRVRRSTGAILILVAATLSAVVGVHRLTHWDAWRVRRVLESVEGVRDVKVWEYSEVPLSWTAVRARITVSGSPDRVIILDAPDAADLRDGRHIWVTGIGPYRFAHVDDARKVWGGSIDVGTEGDFGALLGIEVADVGGLVERYDEACAALSRMPPTGTFVGESGVEYRIAISSDGTSPTLP